MGTTKKNEIKEIQVLTEEQIDALPTEAVEVVRVLSGSLPTAQLMIFVPVVQKYVELREKASKLRLERDEELEFTPECIKLYKEVKKEVGTFNGELKRKMKEIKDPINAMKSDILNVENTFKGESDKIKETILEEFQEYEDELEKAKQAALDKKNAAMNAQIAAANEEAERLQKQSEVSNLYNTIKYTRIQEEITNAVDDAIFNNNEDALAALKAKIAQKTWNSIIAGVDVLTLDDTTVEELQEGFLKAKERAVFKLDQKFEEYEAKRVAYAAEKAKEVIPAPPLGVSPMAGNVYDPATALDTDDIQRTEPNEKNLLVTSVLTTLKFEQQKLLARIQQGGASQEVKDLYNELEILINKHY